MCAMLWSVTVLDRYSIVQIGNQKISIKNSTPAGAITPKHLLQRTFIIYLAFSMTETIIGAGQHDASKCSVAGMFRSDAKFPQTFPIKFVLPCALGCSPEMVVDETLTKCCLCRKQMFMYSRWRKQGNRFPTRTHTYIMWKSTCIEKIIPLFKHFL